MRLENKGQKGLRGFKRLKGLKQRGFTLVELLIVIFIIALLTSIGLLVFSGVRAKGRDAKRIADLGQVAAALQLYYADNHSYFRAYGVAGADDVRFNNLVSALVTNKYLESTITNDTNATYKYRYTLRGSDYWLYFTPEVDKNKTCPVLPATTCTATYSKLYLIKNGQVATTW